MGLFHISARAFFLMMEALGLLILGLFLGAGILLWRVGQGPLNLEFAKPFIERTLSSDAQDYQVHLKNASLNWPERQSPVVLSVDGLNIKRKNGAGILNIDAVDLSFSYVHLLIGQIRPVSIILQKPSILLVRHDNGVEFMVRDQNIFAQNAPSTSSSKSAAAQISEFVSWIENPHLRTGPLEALKSVEVKNASVLIRDMTQKISWFLSDLDFTVRDEKEGLSAFFSISTAAQKTARQKPADLTAYLTYRRARQDFAFSANVDQFNPIILSKFLPDTLQTGATDIVFSGQMGALFDKKLALQSASINIFMPAGVIDIPQEFDAPIAIKNFRLETGFTRGDKTFRLNQFKADVAGIPLSGQGHVVVTPDGMNGPIIFKTSGDIPTSALKPVFPNSEKDGEAAKWLLHQMTGGVYRDVVFSSEMAFKRPKDNTGWSFATDKTKLNFGFEGVKVNYEDTLLPAENAKGRGMLDVSGDILTIDGSANIGNLIGKKAHLEFTDIMVKGGGYAKISIDASGPLQTAFDYISAPPISMGDTFGFDRKNVKGNIDLTAQIDFPTILDAPREAFKVTAKATLKDVTLPKVVEGLTLTGGPLALDVEEGAFRVKGTGKLDGRDVALNWHEYFDAAGKPYASQVTAKILADDDLRRTFGVNLDDYMSGSVAADVTYTDFADDRSTLDMTGDMKALNLHIKPFKYSKPIGQAGSISFKANLNKGILKSLEGLKISAPNLMVDKAHINFAPMNGKSADISSGTLPSISIGSSSLTANFDVTAQNILNIKANGPVFDAAPFMTGSDTAQTTTAPPSVQQKMNISLNVDKMLTGENVSIGKTKLYIETDADADMTRMEMDSVAGAGNVMLRFMPDASGKRIFKFEADDAGAALNAFGVYDKVRGGAIRIYGEPQGGNVKGDIIGTAQMEDFKVVKAPALAKLLSLMSLTGVGQLLNDQGLAFSKLESNFEWRFKPEGNQLILKDGRTSGSSIGLTFEGKLDRQTKTTDVRGTIIPMTEINDFLKKIPIVGEILTGGSGLIAATYTIKGPTENPDIMVNPLSVLTPGFLRTILFEGGFENKAPTPQK